MCLVPMKDYPFFPLRTLIYDKKGNPDYFIQMDEDGTITYIYT